MMELVDEEDGRIALIMDKDELPFAVEALMRAGYGLTPPEAGAEEPGEEEEAGEPDEEEVEEPEAVAEEPDEEEDEEPEVEEDEGSEEPRPRSRRSRSG
jgi:hypothetical protein